MYLHSGKNMANLIKVKRGTLTQLDTAATGNLLIQGEPYLITDQGRLAIGLTSGTYAAFAKTTEVQPLDGDLTAIAGLSGTTGFLKKTAADTYVLDTSTYLTAESDTLTTVLGRGATTTTAASFFGGISVNQAGSTNGVTFAGSTSGSSKLQASAVAGTTTFTLPTTSGTLALAADIPTVNNGTFAVSIGVAATTGSALAWGTTTGFSANTNTNSTYDLRIGPSISALATLMSTAGAGFIRRGASADTYTIDTNTYLTGNQSISLTGDITGSGTTGIATTLATVNSNVGTFPKVTVNAKGLVTAASALIATDIPTLTAAKISDFDTQVRTSRLDQMAAPTADVAFNNRKITGLADPTLAQDAATKAYVDGVAQGLDIKASVRAATTANITLSGTQTIDGVAVIADERVLVKNQTTTTQNGIYIVAAGAWARSADTDTWNELISAFTFVEEGTTQADSSWVSTVNAGGTLGVTAVTFVQFGSASSYSGGAGLTLDGNVFNVGGTSNRITVNTDTVDIASTYVGQTSITTLGTVGTGTWDATAIGVTKGGLGLTAAVTGLLKGNGTIYSAATEGTDYLSANSTIDGGTF
jgi:hypothetical protein